MTKEQKEEIQKLRDSGYGYATIADALGLTKNQVSAFCRREGLAGSVRASVCSLVELFECHILPDSDFAGYRRLVRRRGKHIDITDFGKGFYENLKPLALNSVIVGDKNLFA